MSRNLAMRRLWWKELRQLVPLVGLLILMGVLLQVLAVLLPFGQRLPWRDVATLLGMPGLFAAGVGALLIGQEKEARTLDWLRSLPLAAGDLIRVKLLVALLGLLAVWSVSLSLAWATGAWDTLRDGKGSELLWPLHSVFLLLVGFATAWRFRSSMIAMLLVVPLASLPLMLASAHQSVIDWDVGGWRLWKGEPTVELMAIYLTIFGAGFGWYGWRAGLAYLAPQSAPRNPAQAQATAKTSLQSALGYRSIAPAPALLWQFLKQNLGLLAGLAGLLLLPIIFDLAWGIVGSLLAVSWLGASVFQGDALQRRVLFLADRGVSPWLVWWTRQLVPLGLVLLGLLLLWTAGIPSELAPARLLDSTTMTLIAALLLSVYLSSQWLGQIATSPIVAAITAPLVAVATAAYIVYCSVELEANWWSVAAALVVPIVATGWGARDWMDRRSTPRMWSRHIGLAVIYLVLPLTSFLIAWASLPSVSASALAELQSIHLQHARYGGQPRDLTARYDALGVDESGDHEQSLRDAIAKELAEDSRAIRSAHAHVTCISAALQWRLKEQTQPGSADSEQHITEYRAWLTVLLDLHDRLRMSWRLLEQDQADAIEMWLVEELKAVGAQQRLGDDLLERMYMVFNNSGDRDAARRRAVGLSWAMSGEDQMFGGYLMQGDRGSYITTKDVWVASRQSGVLGELLLESLAARGSELATLRERIGAIAGYPAAAQRQMYVKDAAGQRQLLYFETMYGYMPGAFWNGIWEGEGAELVQSRFAPRN